MKMNEETKSKKITVPILKKMKARGEKIAALTAYDYLLASLLDAAGLDLILVGDSGAMVFAGYDSTIPITMDEMLYHTRCVRRGVKRALLVADMPFLSYQTSVSEAIHNAGRFLKEAQAEAVKVEGGAFIAETVNQIVQAGIPVMGHLGLTPQSIHQFGSYSVQAKNEIEAKKLLKDAQVLEQAGVFAIVLEKIPATLAKEVTASIQIPTIGIGAGIDCDGQILVTQDLLGLFEKFRPKFVRRYAELGAQIRQACSNYVQDTKTRQFPNENESF